MTPALLLALALPTLADVQPLTWAPPALTNPETVQLGDVHRSLKLDRARDFIVKLPADKPWIGELNVFGGRNVVIIGGEIRIPSPAEDPSFADDAEPKRSRRALYLKEQHGTVHVEGVLFSGGGLREGINLDQRIPGCVVQLQNIRSEKLDGSFAGHHADVIQTWAGPSELRIDRLTAATAYQGFFLLPNQHFAVDQGGHPPKQWDFRRINLLGTEASAYLLWRDGGNLYPVLIEDVWVRPAAGRVGERDAYLWPKPTKTGDTTWAKVQEGLPPGGDFVPDGAAGLGYVSPGYLEPQR
jgi:hypothetical protein